MKKRVQLAVTTVLQLTKNAIIFITHMEKLRHRELNLSEVRLLEAGLRLKVYAFSTAGEPSRSDNT